MACYRLRGCGPYEMYSCSDCPASKAGYMERNGAADKSMLSKKGRTYVLGIKNDPLDKRLESAVEHKLKTGIRELGGEIDKVVSQSRAGFPDRLIMLNSKVYFVELKKTDGKPRKDQEIVHELMNAAGIDVYVTYGVSGVKEFLEMIK